MVIKHFCRKCGTELSTENVSPGYAYVCPNCDEDMFEFEAVDRYIPTDSNNSVFAVDVYVPLAKCIKIEAKTKEEADAKVRKAVTDALAHVDEMEVGNVLSSMRFHGCDDIDTTVSGEADENGEIGYY